MVLLFIFSVLLKELTVWTFATQSSERPCLFWFPAVCFLPVFLCCLQFPIYFQPTQLIFFWLIEVYAAIRQTNSSGFEPFRVLFPFSFRCRLWFSSFHLGVALPHYPLFGGLLYSGARNYVLGSSETDPFLGVCYRMVFGGDRLESSVSFVILHHTDCQMSPEMLSSVSLPA